ncbi:MULTISPECIES: hypothetical protein [Streptomyces]|uniref:Uncharacterized protein n=1 Tax=Streptomyces ochraceiscleroticus TaxID=47761 RepID=A0ABW1MDN2_9ACTN|nr:MULTISPECIES: hypothetical protein [Streptomyces]
MVDPSTLLALQTSNADGPGWILRAVIIVGVLGAIFMAWFLLRGYGGDQD